MKKYEPIEKLIFIGGLFYLFIYASLIILTVFHDADIFVLVLFVSGFGFTCAICNYLYEISVKKFRRKKK